ncbi:hypothetical protein [Capnocytophaga cynodegmi]|uniref:hypothetical protein n=2 Tax=Capnocytophaga cynodegmi TaxID=28189 RepID=UPI00385E0D15
MPYLLDTKIKVKFDGIKINSERQLFEGKLVTTYDKTESNVIEIKSWEEVENAVAESLKAQEQIIKEVTDLEKKYAENKLNSQEFQREIEEKNKKWQEEILKTSKIIDFVVTSPAILIPERKELLEQQKELSKNINLDKENLKKVKEKTKQIAQISKNVKKKHQNNVAESKKKLEEFAKKQNICGEWIAKKGKFGRVQIDYIAYQECTYGTLFRLENNVYIYQTNYNLYQTTWSTELGIERFYIYASDLKTWVEFVPENRKFHRGEMPEMMKDIIFGVADFWIPLEDGTVLLTGKNFDREEKSRVVAAGLFVFNISAGKVVKLVKGTGKVIGKGAKYLGDEVVKVISKGGKGEKVLNAVGRVIKNGNKIEYTNPAGKILKWSEQGVNDIENAIQATKRLDKSNPNNIGRITEGKVAEFVKSKKKVVGFGQKIEPNITDLDVSTLDEIIEVKASFSAVKEKQLDKLLNNKLDNFCNPEQKRIVLYIDKPMEKATKAQLEMIERIKKKNVIVVNSLEELGKILK